MRTIVGVTLTNRLDADAGTAKTSRPTVASNPTSGRVRCERPEAGRDGWECMGALPGAPPRPPEFGATLSCRPPASQLERLANDGPLGRRGLVEPPHGRGVRRVLGDRWVLPGLAQAVGDRVGEGVERLLR